MTNISVQSRKSHTKSRRGCSACKERHQKCDETRPSCVNCQTAHRTCPYLDDETNLEQSLSTTPVNASPSVSNDSSTPIQLILRQGLDDCVLVGYLQHWLSHTYQTCVGPKAKADAFGPIVLNRALKSPFLMQSMLALAALHKSSTTSGVERQAHLVLAKTLQAEGLTAFNMATSNLDADTAVSAFMFAFITGTHQLCHALGQPHRQDQLLSLLIESITFFRGVQIIVGGWWPHIQSSELSILIPDTSASKSGETSPHDHPSKFANSTSHLWRMLATTEHDPDCMDVYGKVLDNLAKAYNELSMTQKAGPDMSIGSVVVWMITAPPQFIEFCRERRPEALIMLAHLAPLINYRRTCWGIRDDASISLINAVSSQLEGKWQQWLGYPRFALQLG